MKMERYKTGILTLVVSGLICGVLFSFSSEARRVKDVKYPAAVWKYSPLTNEITEGIGITDAVYPYPVATMTHPIATAYWIEKMIKEEGYNAPQSIIYLSPYPCYQTGKIKEWQNSNWLRYVLEKGYAKKAYVIYPPYMYKETAIKDRFLDQLSGAEHDISLLDSIARLPSADELGQVLVVIDASYFSNQQTPYYSPADIIEIQNEPFGNIIRYPISLIFSTADAVRELKNKKLDITALAYNMSPNFPFIWHASIVQEWLLLYLERMNE